MENKKELFKEIRKCPCKPYYISETYCKSCQDKIMAVINDYGLGVLE